MSCIGYVVFKLCTPAIACYSFLVRLGQTGIDGCVLNHVEYPNICFYFSLHIYILYISHMHKYVHIIISITV